MSNQTSKLRSALEQMYYAVCGETGFAEAVRHDRGIAYPWPALDIAEAAARDALDIPELAKVEPVEPLHVRLAGLARSLEGEYPPHVIEDVLEASRIAALPLHEGSGS